MRSFFATLRRLVLPGGAQPGTPRLVLGPDLPVPLNTYDFTAMFPFGTGPFKAAYAIIWYIGTPGDSYNFMAMVNNSPTTVAGIVFGSVNGTSMVEVSPGLPQGDIHLFGNTMVNQYSTTDFFNGVNFMAGGLVFVNWFNDFKIDPNGVVGVKSHHRGILLASNTGGSHTTASGVKTTLINVGSVTYKNGRHYIIKLYTNWSASVANSQALVELDRSGGAGVVGPYRTIPLPVAASQITLWHEFEFNNSSGADVTDNLAIAVTPPAATTVTINGAGLAITQWEVTDEGSASDYPSIPTL